MSKELNLLRSQIARIVGNDPRAIRAFEALFSQTSTVIPSNVQDVEIAAANAEAMAAQAVGAIDRLATTLGQAVALLESAPPVQPVVLPDDLTPPYVPPAMFDVVSVSAATSIRGMQFADVDASGAAVTVTLPPPSENIGKVCGVAKNDASGNAVTVSGTINGAATYPLPAQYDAKMFISIGAEWRAL